ncbi:MAG TPA: helix-turn-helix domain-containing protein [Actinocrinis sp.]|uniref:winged helix-turn-helix transcriptional regulator n=1 Tax=Actinocrinis sp. TaxID=1920516 RepID=UPI002DDD50ED|nr:helix-turn-helix domain-containing protein [Actinocrinis sp.]HEV2346701.1 helix-turn-helix domain-containing protein [Actinocrinis sp.]
MDDERSFNPMSVMADVPVGVRPCSIADALDILGERWSLLAIRELGYGVHRFSRIVGFTGAPRDILADRLRKLEAAGIVERRQYSEHPPRFEYHLTQAGRELLPVMLALRQWGDRWASREPTLTIQHSCGHSLDTVTACGHCGRVVEVADMVPARPAGAADAVDGVAGPDGVGGAS